MVQKATISQNSNKVIAKPQQNFEDKIDNSNLPFVPKIKIKLNFKTQLPGKKLILEFKLTLYLTFLF